MTKIEKLKKAVRNEFSTLICVEFKKKFRRNLICSYSFLNGALISYPKNGKPLTKQQHDWIAGFEAGYHVATAQLIE